MGGWMTYQRMRARNAAGPETRKPDSDPDPYWRKPPRIRHINPEALIGDMNRMERDYLTPAYPQPPMALRPDRSDPASQCAEALGIDVETVRAVLRYVFLEQR